MLPKIISPQERLQLLPFEPALIRANDQLPFIRLEDYRNLPPSDLTLQPMEYHIIAFHHKPPQGPLKHRCGGRWYESQMRPFDITYVPAYRDNQWQFDGRSPHCLHILLSHTFIKQIITQTWDTDPGRLDLHPQFQNQHFRLKQIALQLHHTLLHNQTADAFYMESLAATLALQLLTNVSDALQLPHIGHQLSKQQLNQITAYLQDHITEPVSLQQMADLLHLSVFHFSRMFRNTLGITPYQFLLHLRLETALTALLQHPHHPISHIALSLGFADQSHFTRHFRKKYHLTPRAFRRQYAQ